MRALWVIPVSLFLGACQAAETTQEEAARIDAESSAARTEIESTTANLARWFSSAAVDSAATGVTEDYHWLPPNQPADSGRANWVRVNKAMFATGKVFQALTNESVVANGPIAVSRGRYVSTFTPGPGAPSGALAAADTGKYLWQWRKVDGRWLLAIASWSSDLPARR